MKKKLAAALLAITLSVTMAACGGKEPSNINTPAVTEKPTEPSNSSSNKESEKTLEDIENYLLDSGVLSGERVQMAAEMVGGIAGFKYKDSVGEIYEYDTESEKYIKLKNGEEISLEGMNGFTTKAVSINGKFVLFGNNVPQELVDAFNSFK